MTTLVESIRAEFLRFKALAEGAIAQVPVEKLAWSPGAEDNSIVVICWHIAGNLESRFTNFLSEDGEKAWRHRDSEFDSRNASRDELLAKWERGWRVLLSTLDTLTDADLSRTVTIRNQALPVHEALHRALAHVSYHVGQIVYLAKSVRAGGWTSLSIPRGQSETYRHQPLLDRPPGSTRG